MTKRGGKRPNAGRKAGSITKKSRAIADNALTSGITPLDYMLSILRNESGLPLDRFEAAKAAAPYVHPRLNAIAHSGSISHTPEEALEKIDQSNPDDATREGNTPPSAG